MTLTIIAHIHAKPSHREKVKSELVKLIAPTQAEAGCLQYDLHQDNENPDQFLFVENWENKKTWDDHMKAPHLAAFGKATDGALESVVVQQMSQIGT